MKRILLLLLMGSFLSLLAYAQTVKYIGCSPTDGSSIDEFKFTLTFDITEAAESLGTGDWGLGYLGNGTTQYTKLYEGTTETGVELAEVMTSNFTGKSEGFQVNGNTISVAFPSSVIPKANQVYTLEIRNNFVLFQNGKAVQKSSTSLKFADNPLILTFIGKQADADKLLVQNISIEDNASLDELKEVKYTFNTAITSISGAKVTVKENDKIICESLSTTVENGNILVADFGDNVNLNFGHTYNVVLPAGVVSMASDSSKSNNEFSFIVNGTKTYMYGIADIYPSSDSTCLPVQARIKYEVPEDASITGGKNQWIDTSLKIYKSEISEDSLISSLYGSSSADVITWDLSSLSFEPSTKYILYREEGLNNLFYKDNFEKIPEWSNEETNSFFVTPSIEDSGIPQLVFRNPVNGKYEGTGTELLPNSIVEYIQNLQVSLKDFQYTYEDNKYDLTLLQGTKVFIYDTTDGSEVLIGERAVTRQLIEPADWHLANYYALNMGIQMYFYEGHKYKLVIPQGYLGCGLPLIRNYLSTGWTFEFEGATPTKVEPENCSLPENSELSELSSVRWTFKGGFSLDTDKSVMLKYSYTSTNGLEAGMSVICPTTIANYGNQTIVYAYLPASADGMGYQFNPKYNKYEIIFPEGLIYLTGDPSVKNSEMVYTIKPIAKASNEYVNLSVEMSDVAAIHQKAIKGEPITITLTPTDDWKVESVMLGDKVLSAKNGIYTTEPLNEDANIKANLTYAGQLATEITTDVWEITDKNISIYRDNDHIVVDGVTPANTINVYSVSGLLITSIHATDGNDRVNITVPSGQMYIVSVDGVAAKISM